MKHQLESGTASIRVELESSKAEVVRLTQIIEALRSELEKIKRENSEVIMYSTVLYVQYAVQYSNLLYSL